MSRIPEPIRVIQRPTPLHKLERISAQLGCEIWIKRDDLTGFALGGNKGRKLEYLVADIVAQGADTVVTCGATQSNFIRQLGVFCAMVGVRCAAVVMDSPFPDGNTRPASSHGHQGGNTILNEFAGVEKVAIPDGPWSELEARAKSLAESLRAEGRKVYEIPIGGSTPLGAYSFREAGRETAEQGPEFDQIVTASSSGSTQVGLMHWFAGTKTKVIGVSCDPEPEIVDDMAVLASELDDLTGVHRDFRASDFDFRLDYVGDGYGVPSEEGRAAITLLARTEGIFLDPIYSGKAFAGLISLAGKGELTGKTLFWHTGGTPALFTY